LRKPWAHFHTCGFFLFSDEFMDRRCATIQKSANKSRNFVQMANEKSQKKLKNIKKLQICFWFE